MSSSEEPEEQRLVVVLHVAQQHVLLEVGRLAASWARTRSARCSMRLDVGRHQAVQAERVALLDGERGALVQQRVGEQPHAAFADLQRCGPSPCPTPLDRGQVLRVEQRTSAPTEAASSVAGEMCDHPRWVFTTRRAGVLMQATARDRSERRRHDPLASALLAVDPVPWARAQMAFTLGVPHHPRAARRVVGVHDARSPTTGRSGTTTPTRCCWRSAGRSTWRSPSRSARSPARC